jgi:hypothetical protein
MIMADAKRVVVVVPRSECVVGGIKNNLIIRLIHTKLDEKNKQIKMEGNPKFWR